MQFKNLKVKTVVRAPHAGPCGCGHNRWQTVKKGKEYHCRRCGDIRTVGVSHG